MTTERQMPQTQEAYNVSDEQLDDLEVHPCFRCGVTEAPGWGVLLGPSLDGQEPRCLYLCPGCFETIMLLVKRPSCTQ